MDDLLDRLAVLSPGPSRDPDLAFVRTKARTRRRRRTGVLGVAAAVVLVAVGVFVTRFMTDDSPRRVDVVGVPSTVPASWGGPVEVLAGDDPDELFVQFSNTGVQDGGIARLDPHSGALIPIVAVPTGSTVAVGAGSLWVSGSSGRWLDRLDPESGVRQHRFDLRLPDNVHPGRWRIGVTADGLWVANDQVPGTRWFGLEGNGASGLSNGGDPVLAGPVVVGDEAWFGSANGLRHETEANGVTAAWGSAELGRVTALAWGGDRLWVARSDGAGGAATVGYLPLDAPSGERDPLRGTVELDGGVEQMAVSDGQLCVDVEGTNTTPSTRCGPVPALGSRTAPDLEPVEVDGEPLRVHSALTAYDGAVWGTRWEDGVVVRIDPAERTSRVVVDLPFEVSDPLDALMEPVGPDHVIASGRYLGGEPWRYVAFETRTGICAEVRSEVEGAAACWPLPPDAGTLSVGYASTATEGIPATADATVLPEVDLVRFELSNGQRIERVPVDVGLPLEFVHLQLPDGVGVDAAVALDADGGVLATGRGVLPTPGQMVSVTSFGR